MLVGALVVLAAAGGAGAWYSGALDGVVGTKSSSTLSASTETETKPVDTPPTKVQPTTETKPAEQTTTPVETKAEQSSGSASTNATGTGASTATQASGTTQTSPQASTTPTATTEQSSTPAQTTTTAQPPKTESQAKPQDQAAADGTQVGPDGVVVPRTSFGKAPPVATGETGTKPAGSGQVALNVPNNPASTVDAVDGIAERIAWVRGYTGGDCFFATATDASATKTEIEGFGDSVESFQNLLKDFKAKFGSEPDIGVRLIRDKQCPVTSFMHAFAQSAADTPDLSLVKYELVDRDPMSGQVQLQPSKQTYLILVDHDGIAHNLEAILQKSGDLANFNISLGLGTSRGGDKTAVPEVLIAFSTAKPVEAMSGFSSAPSAQLLPKITDELRSRDIQAAATARYFRIRG